MPKKTDAQKRSDAAKIMRKAAGDKPHIARWKDKTPEEKKAHADHMNKFNPTWKKHLENVAALGDVLGGGDVG